MRLEWLEDILAVADTGSLSEAAERRCLTQSAFSRRIQSIEEFVGVKLFDRTRKPIQLHATTKNQRAQIIHLAAELRQLVVDLRRGDRMSSNRIVMASQHTLTATFTPAIIERIQSKNDDIYIKLRSANLGECFALLLSRQVDVAIAYRSPGDAHPIDADYIETVQIGTDRLVPVFDARKQDQFEERMRGGNFTYIAYPSDVFLGQVLESMILGPIRNTLAPMPRAETALTLAAVELAAIGVGVAWAPMSLVASRIEDGKLLDLSDRLPGCDLDITAVRIEGNAGPMQAAIWNELTGRAEV